MIDLVRLPLAFGVPRSRLSLSDTFIGTTADSILAKNTDGDGHQGNSYVGPVALWSPPTQASAAAALIADLDSSTAPPPGRGSAGPSTPAGRAMIKGSESGRCVDVPRVSTAIGTKVTLWDCNSGVNQTWTATPSKQLLVYGTKCLDVTGAATADGTLVQIWDCHGGTNQQWTVNDDGTIVSVASGKCLDAAGHRTANSTPVKIYPCNGGANQRWSRT